MRILLPAMALIVTLFISGCTDSSAKTANGAKSEPPLAVTISSATRTEMIQTVEVLGTSRSDESVDIMPVVTERVEQIHFDDGQSVKKGQLLVTLRHEEEKARLKSAREELREQEREFRRIQNLVKTNAAAQSSLDERKTLLEQARHDIAVIQAQIEDRIIRAPFEGIVGLRNVSPGMLVESDTLITTLDDIRKIKVDFSVPSVYLKSTEEGLEISASPRALPDATYTGRISKVDVRIDPMTRSFTARALFENSDFALKPGMLFVIDLIKARKHTLVIPESAVVKYAEKAFVFALDDADKIIRKEVETGIRKPGYVEILTGIEEGQRVVIDAVHRVREGQLVTVKAERELNRVSL